MIENLFRLGLILIPFTSFKGLPGLGELQHELSAHVFLLVIGLSLLTSVQRAGAEKARLPSFGKIYAIPVLALFFMAAILVSLLANLETIKTATFLGRSGLGKFATSSILVFYGFALATATYALSARRDWETLILKPISVSVMICAAFSVLEMGAHYVGGLSGIYGIISDFIHSGENPPEWDTRLRSVGFEPPDFANTAGYIWPWLLGAIQFSRGAARTRALVLWLILNLMIYLSGARTSLVVISGLVGVFIALRTIYLPLKPREDTERLIFFVNIAFLLILPLVFLGFALNTDVLVRHAVTGDRVSDLSRLASITAALRMMADHPFLGMGFGQFGFHAGQYMPSWGFLSYEIKDWISGESGYWPATYSVYARFGADMGAMGLTLWIGIWLWLARAVLMATLRHRKETGALPAAAYPLIMSCLCVLLAGVPNDSVRAPMIWITMGLACRYVQDLRLAHEARAQKRA